MKRFLCVVSVMLVLGFGATIAATLSQPADAQDQTDERLAALETAVADQASDISSLRKRVRKLEDAAKTPTADVTDETGESNATAVPTEAGEAAEPAEQTSTYLGGNALSLLPSGEKGKLDVVLAGTYDGNILPLIVRNNSAEDVIRIQVSAVARSAEGKLLASGGDQGFNPNLVRVGEYSLGYVYFDGVALPADVTFEFEVTATDADEEQFISALDLDVVEADFLGDRIVGMMQNNHDETVTGPIGISVACLGGEGTLLGHFLSFADKDEAAPGDTVPFQVDLYGVADCSNFLVAGSGYSF